jgi:molybdopterin/thiamine biosynthesis adenylyltransferase
MKNTIRVVDCYEVPAIVKRGTAYRLLPKNLEASYYRERTDRNIGWITPEEQALLQRTTIGIAGCGGMGAQVAEKFLRLGVGEIRIADNEAFEVSNINRQFGAARSSIGKSKAFETAKLLRAITDDSTIVVYPQGITTETSDDFAKGCDLVCDEIEFWCAGSRIALHQSARRSGVPIFVCNTIGFGSHVFLFTPTSTTIEKCLGVDYEEAAKVEKKILEGKAQRSEIAFLMEAVIRGLFPAWVEYNPIPSGRLGKSFLRNRLMVEQRGAIIATNPPLACGLLADRVLLHILRSPSNTQSEVRQFVVMPEMPGYLYFDAATMVAKVVTGKWW